MKQSIMIVITVSAVLTACTAAAIEKDSDGDGLSDFNEVHKYLTNPADTDSDGDGIQDGRWEERWEYTYTIRSVIKVMRPCNPAAMNDDYQDARVLSQTDDYVKLEVIHYPFNTNASSITGERDWQDGAPTLELYLEPGITTNWDAQMRRDLLDQLKAAGVDVADLTDKQIVERVSSWLMKQSRALGKVFTTHYVYYPEGKPTIYPGLKEAFKREFERDSAKYDWTMENHFNHELLGRGMFYSKTHGSCTSFAVYLTTVLRTLGLPTRMVLAIPVVDPSDYEQVKQVEKHITHHEVRQTLLEALRGLMGYAAHTFNEVYVGGRWQRLNYSKLGQNIYGKGVMGLLTHVNTFSDLSEAGLAATWGIRYAKGLKDSTFQHKNPYRTMELSDNFGVHSQLANPAVEEPRVEEPKTVLIAKAYWFFSEERPESIPGDSVQRDNDGHLMFHVKTSSEEMHLVYTKLDKHFQLTAEGHPPVLAQAERGYWGIMGGGADCYVRIRDKELAKMEMGVPYSIKSMNPDSKPKWEVGDGVRITRTTGGSEPGRLKKVGFEYKVLEIGQGDDASLGFDPEKTEDRLNELGREGWETVNVFGVNHEHGGLNHFVVVLKRPTHS